MATNKLTSTLRGSSIGRLPDSKNNNIASSIFFALQSQKVILQHNASFAHFQKPQSGVKSPKFQEIHTPNIHPVQSPETPHQNAKSKHHLSSLPIP
jgi:hypothetical protein